MDLESEDADELNLETAVHSQKMSTKRPIESKAKVTEKKARGDEELNVLKKLAASFDDDDSEKQARSCPFEAFGEYVSKT